MGYIRHHTIAVTSFSKERLKECYEKAKKIENINLTSIYASNINSWYTFYVVPDGSKEGWSASKDGDIAREKLIELIKSMDYD